MCRKYSLASCVACARACVSEACVRINLLDSEILDFRLWRPTHTLADDHATRGCSAGPKDGGRKSGRDIAMGYQEAHRVQPRRTPRRGQRAVCPGESSFHHIMSCFAKSFIFSGQKLPFSLPKYSLQQQELLYVVMYGSRYLPP